MVRFLSNRLAILVYLTTTLVGTGDAFSDCIRCSCTKKLYQQSELAKCQSECKVGLGCFTGICEPAGMSGTDPSAAEDSIQRSHFPRLTCYTVTAPPNPAYNCIACSVGVTNRWIWQEVDGYGNRDGVVTVSDFDAYFSYGGYTPTTNCSVQLGKEKIVLFGQTDASGTVVPTHAARQASVPISGFLFESKEGRFKQILHDLSDLEGGAYGAVVKCYER
jgi:hypothetical protein